MHKVSKPNNLKFLTKTMSNSVISAANQGFQWQTEDPFLFCVHHRDVYPKGSGDANLGLADKSLLRGREMGMDFTLKDGFRWYHGTHKPGFPQHPHRGFETLTLARHGFIDHSDSLGATARFGNNDAQWMTAGKGISHCEMFPLLNTTDTNLCELFQIWINLPNAKKTVDPFFKMLWSTEIPKFTFDDGKVEVVVVAQSQKEPLDFAEGQKPPTPPPNSYAASDDSHVSVFTVKIQPGGSWTLPKTVQGSNRNLYYFVGSDVLVAGQSFPKSNPAIKIKLQPTHDILIENKGSETAEFLYLSAKPIGEPVVQQGPFVGASKSDIMQAYKDYQSGKFGRWPFDSDEPVHGKDAGRFAIYPDGRKVVPPASANEKSVRDEL